MYDTNNISDLKPTYIVQPKSSNWKLDIKNFFEYQDLVSLLVFRDIKIRYVQSILGVGWALIQPLFSMVIFTFIFGHLAKIPSNDIPYPLFSYVGLVPWVYFSSSLADASSSLVSNASMINKIYFPKIILPLSAIFSKSLDFFISLSLTSLLLWRYSFLPSLSILYLPFLILLLITCTAGFSFWLSALSIQYRDIRYGLGFFLQLLQYLAPVVYPYSIIPEKYKIIYALNPMVGIIEGFRSCLCTHSAPSLVLISISTVSTLLLFITGIFYFKSTEKLFADVV